MTEYSSSNGFEARSCNCIGPQNGQPKCPCMMINMKEVDGRWVEVIDHGPVRKYDENINPLRGIFGGKTLLNE